MTCISMHKRRAVNQHSATACQLQQSWCTQSFSVICTLYLTWRYYNIHRHLRNCDNSDDCESDRPLHTGDHCLTLTSETNKVLLRETVCPRHSWPHGLAYLESPLPILVPQRAHNIASVSQNSLLPRECSL